MKETIEAVLLAGGRGMRIGRKAESTQKCLLYMQDRPILHYIMEALVSSFGSVDLKVAIAYKADLVKEYIDKNRPSKKIVPTYVYDNGKGDWQAYYGMKDYIHGRFLGLPSDVITTPLLYYNAINSCPSDSIMTFSFSLNHKADTHPLGKVEEGRVQELQFPVKQTDYPKVNQLRDVGIYALNPGFFTMLEKYPSSKINMIDSVVLALKNNIELRGIVTSEPWIHIGYPEDLELKWQ